MRYIHSLFSFSMIIWCVISFGCNNGAVPDQPGPLFDTVEAAKQAGDFFMDICNDNQWPDDADSFLDYAQSLEEVATVELKDDETCVIQYQSGVLHYFNCNLKGEADDDNETEADIAAARVTPYGFPEVTERSTPPATVAVYPGGSGSAVISSSSQQVIDALEYAGYIVPDTPESPTVEWFKNWDDNHNGVIYLNGHGGSGSLPAAEDPSDNSSLSGRSFNYIYTTTEIDGAAYEDSEYAEDINAHLIEFGSGEHGNTLVLTPLFFDRYLDGGLPNSIIYLDTCFSLDTGVDVSLADTFINNGAEIVFGWNNRVLRRRGSQTAALFFDRLCGYSQVEADDLTPPSRPFTALQVYEHLEEEGRTRQSRANLSYQRRTTTGDEDTAARPIITGGYYQWAAEAVAGVQDPSIVLTGYFGPNQGQVRLNNQPLSQIVLWQSDQIVAMLSDDSTAGDIVVRVNDNLDSNAMRLTSFSGSADWTIQRTGQYSGTISAEFEGRVLLQLMRSEIDGEATTAQGLFSNSLFAAERGSLNWEISGEWTDEFGDYHEVEAQGSGPVVPQSITYTGTPGMSCLIEFVLDPDVSEATYELLLAAIVTGTETITTSEGATTQQPWVGVYGTTDMTTQSLPANWVIPAGSATCEDCQTFQWSEIRPDTAPIPPTDDDAYHARTR